MNTHFKQQEEEEEEKKKIVSSNFPLDKIISLKDLNLANQCSLGNK